MKPLDRLQRRFGRFAIPRLTEGLICCQVLTYLLFLTNPAYLARIAFVPERVLHGEVWRLFTFVCQPPCENPICLFFFWCVFYLMGTTLEATWGSFRYNVYLGVGWLATVAVAFLQPTAAASIAFLQASVFFAFAYLYPDFQLLLFFILPVKVKWLAWFQAALYLLAVIAGDWMLRLLILASVANFFLFFGRDILLRMRSGKRRMSQQTQQIRKVNKPLHTCAICGKTNLSDPKMLFRYCSKCDGAPCYCEDHIRAHEHRVADAIGSSVAIDPAA